MQLKVARLFMSVTASTFLVAFACPTSAGEASVTVLSVTGTPVAGAMVVAEPASPAPRPADQPRAVMDQRNLMFVPEVLVVRTGTLVDFPNSDQVRHMVYSFSGAKVFQLPLYAGRTQPPVLFDKPGLVTLGCNIHDNMLGFIYVTDSPWHGRTDAEGRLALRDLPPGSYTLRAWHPLLDETGPQLEQHLAIVEGPAANATFRFKRPLRQPLMHHGANKKWEDY
jgi:plastocyanin